MKPKIRTECQQTFSPLVTSGDVFGEVVASCQDVPMISKWSASLLLAGRTAIVLRLSGLPLALVPRPVTLPCSNPALITLKVCSYSSRVPAANVALSHRTVLRLHLSFCDEDSM